MIDSYILIGALIVWAGITVGITLFAHRGMGKGANEFFLGGRRIGGFVSGMTYAATTYSAFMLVGLVGLTYKTGVGALGFEMTYLIFTVLFLLVFGPRFWLTGKKYGHITPPELLGFRYENKGVSFVAAIICLLMLIPYSSVQFTGAGLLVEGLSGGKIPFFAGVIAMGVFSGITAFWAGMRSVSLTDAFQAIIMAVTSLIAILYVFFFLFAGPVDLFVSMETNHPELMEFTWSPAVFIGLTLPWAFFALTNPQVSQRLFIPDRLQSMRKMILYFAIFGFFYTVVSTLFGFAAAGIFPELSHPDKAMPELLTKLPKGLSVLIFIGIFAAASGTLSSIVLTLSSIFSKDIIKVLNPDITEVSEQRFGRIVMVCILLICISVSGLKKGLIAELASMASAGLFVMAPAIIGAFFWKRGTAQGALVSMIVGGIVTAILYFEGYKPLGWWPAVWGGILTTSLFVIVSMVTTPPKKAEIFIDELEAELRNKGLQ